LLIKKAAKYEGIYLLEMLKVFKAKITYRNRIYLFGMLRNKQGKPKRKLSFGLYINQEVGTLPGREVRLFFSNKGRNRNAQINFTALNVITHWHN